MTWLQILSIVAVMATFMGAGIAVAAYFNGKHIKEGISELAGILTNMQRISEQTHKDTIELLKKEGDILAEMQRTSEQRHKEVMETSDQTHKDTIELLKMGFGNKSK